MEMLVFLSQWYYGKLWKFPLTPDLVPVFSAFSAMPRDLEIHPIVKGFLDVPHVPRCRFAGAQPMNPPPMIQTRLAPFQTKKDVEFTMEFTISQVVL
jgi:hypothetical protein